MTREMLAVLLRRNAAALGIDTASCPAPEDFADWAETADWACDAVAWAVTAGLLRGDTDGFLRPRGETSRAELAVLLQRFAALTAAPEEQAE